MTETLHQAAANEKQQILEQKDKNLRQNLGLLQISFAERQWEHTSEPKPSFFVCLIRYTNLCRNILQEQLDEIKDEINILHTKKDAEWKTKILALIQSLKKKESLERQSNEPIQRIGPWRWELHHQKGLEAYGIMPEDDLLQLHILEFYKTENAKLDLRSIKSDLGKIAEMIVDKYSHIRAVEGYSWLMDHPLAKRLGFTVIPETAPEKQEYGSSFWSQFIDKNGSLNQARAQQLLETGIAPFQPRIGFMLVEDFLQKYLPTERKKHPVELHTIDPEWKKWREELRKENEQLEQDLKKAWDTFEPGDIRPFLAKYPRFMDLLHRADIEDEFMSYLIHAKKQQRTLQEAVEAKEFFNLRTRFVEQREAPSRRTRKILNFE